MLHIVWELVVGREPHEEEDQLNIAIKIRDQGFVPAIPDTCDPALRHVMEMCWKMSPNDRPVRNENSLSSRSNAILTLILLEYGRGR